MRSSICLLASNLLPVDKADKTLPKNGILMEGAANADFAFQSAENDGRKQETYHTHI